MTVAVNLLGRACRDIIIVPSNKISAHNPYGYILVESCIVNANPLFLFYYEEHIYGAGHYQSVMPVGQYPILKLYMCVKKRKSRFGQLLAVQSLRVQRLIAMVKKGKTAMILAVQS